MIWQIQIVHVLIHWSIFASLWTLLYASILKRLFVLSLKISDHGDFIQTKKLKNLESRVEYILWNLWDMLVHRFFPLHHQYVITSILTREEAAIVPDTRSFGILKSIFQTDSESYQGFNIHLEISLSSRSTKMKIGVFTCCKEVYQTFTQLPVIFDDPKNPFNRDLECVGEDSTVESWFGHSVGWIRCLDMDWETVWCEAVWIGVPIYYISICPYFISAFFFAYTFFNF